MREQVSKESVFETGQLRPELAECKQWVEAFLRDQITSLAKTLRAYDPEQPKMFMPDETTPRNGVLKLSDSGEPHMQIVQGKNIRLVQDVIKHHPQLRLDDVSLQQLYRYKQEYEQRLSRYAEHYGSQQARQQDALRFTSISEIRQKPGKLEDVLKLAHDGDWNQMRAYLAEHDVPRTVLTHRRIQEIVQQWLFDTTDAMKQGRISPKQAREDIKFLTKTFLT